MKETKEDIREKLKNSITELKRIQEGNHSSDLIDAIVGKINEEDFIDEQIASSSNSNGEQLNI